MIYQIEKDNLLSKLCEKIVCTGNQYATGLKYGQCKGEKELFAYTMYQDMVIDHIVFGDTVSKIYSFIGGDLEIFLNGVLDQTISGTIDEVVFEIINTQALISFMINSGGALYLIIYNNMGNVELQGDVTEEECPVCVLDKINCISVADMYKIYDKFYCQDDTPLINNIP